MSKEHTSNRTIRWIQTHFDFVTSMMKGGISLASISQSILGHRFVTATTKVLRSCYLTFIPLVQKYFPTRNGFLLVSSKSKQAKEVVYFTSCMNRVLAPSKHMKDKRSVQEVFTSLCTKADIAVIYPENICGLCCGKPLEKFQPEHKEMQDKLYQSLLKTTDNGRIPIVIDHMACTAHALRHFVNSPFTIMDIHQYVLEEIIPNLDITKTDEPIGLFTICSGRKYRFDKTMRQLAELCTTGDIIEPKLPCCRFQGYKGFLEPELTIQATSKLPQDFLNTGITKGYSGSATCEIGLSNATDFSWQGIIYLVDSVTRSKQCN
ncbi:MAG: (Fe-S)-binding protein [Desulfovibrionaceae bacterium]|nr:(Fe-S)-binding protein [Desulfovibrionaceae bacterium]